MADFDSLPSDRVNDGLDAGRSSGPSLLPLVFGFAGILLGGVALFFALSGRGETGSAVEEIRAEMLAEADKHEEVAERLQALESALDKLQRDEGATRMRIQSLTAEVQNALTTVSRELNSTRNGVQENAATVAELVEKLTAAKAAGQAPAASSSTEGRPEAPESRAPEGFREHSVRTGDNYSRMAREYGVTVEAIMEANPNVNPNRLQIGQTILVPVSGDGS